MTSPVLNDCAASYTPGISERRGTTTHYLHTGIINADSQTSPAQAVAATQAKDGRNWNVDGNDDPIRSVDPDGRIAWVPIIAAAIVTIDIIDTANDVKETIDNPTQIVPQPEWGTHVYVNDNGRVSISDQTGQVVTVIPYHEFLKDL